MERNSGEFVTMEGGGRADGVNLGGSGYGASKAGIGHFSEGLAREVEIKGSAVVAFCIDPGVGRTAMAEGTAVHPIGREWQGFVGDWIAAGQGVPRDACARATIRLLEVVRPDLSGGTFSVAADFSEVAAHTIAIREKDLRVMRLRGRILEERDG